MNLATNRKLRNAVLITAGATSFIAAAAGHIANMYVEKALVRVDPKLIEDRDATVGSNLPRGPRADFSASMSRVDAVTAELRAQWPAVAHPEKVVIPSADARYNLAGFIYPAEKPSQNWVVLVHGYRGYHVEMEGYGKYWSDRGYNVFAPDLRGHAESEGEYIGMGGWDSADLLLWIDYLLERYGADVSMVLHGHSMGAATVLMASGMELPSQVEAIVSDCAYSDTLGLFLEILKKRHAPTPPMAPAIRTVMRARAGYDPAAVSPIKAVGHSTTPTLFIHGGADTFIDPNMSVELYAACSAQQRHLHIVPGAAHIESFPIDPDAYFAVVDTFLGRLEN